MAGRDFKFSTDPQLVAKVIDVVGLYLAPPENAIVLCVDWGHLPLAGAKSQIQALDPTAPMLPMQPGLPERRTHDDKRHGTSTLFAALEVATGTVTAACKPRCGQLCRSQPVCDRAACGIAVKIAGRMRGCFAARSVSGG